MTTVEGRAKGWTYLPAEESAAELGAFVRQLERFANQQATLISAAGEEVALPAQLFDVLRRVSGELAAGRGVSVLPRDVRLTTQQAADLLQISRPTLIRLLESGRIRFELVGRHRRILLADLEAYRDQTRAERRAALRQMAREGQEHGLLEITGAIAPTASSAAM